MAEAAVLGAAGHVSLSWDPGDEKSVEQARKEFDGLISRGYSAFEVGEEGERRGKRVTKFDPALTQLVIVGPVAGG